MDKREAIILTAQHLFAKYSPHKTTVEEIIRLAQVAKGTFYKHFPNKDELFLEVARKEAADFITAVHTAIAAEESAREKLKAYWLTAARKIAELKNYQGITEDTFPAILPQLIEIKDRMQEQGKRFLREILEHGNHRGELAVEDVEGTASTLLFGIGIDDFQKMKYLEGIPVDIDQIVDNLVEIIFFGLAAPGTGRNAQV